MEEKTLQDFAAEVSKYFIEKQRDNGESFITYTDDRPDWLRDLIFEAHEEMMPDDWKYRFISEAIDYIADHDEIDFPDELEADIYTHDLTKWLASSVDRIYYLNDAIERGEGMDGFELLALAQLLEKTEVYRHVVVGLQNQLGIDDSTEE